MKYAHDILCLKKQDAMLWAELKSLRQELGELTGDVGVIEHTIEVIQDHNLQQLQPEIPAEPGPAEPDPYQPTQAELGWLSDMERERFACDVNLVAA